MPLEIEYTDTTTVFTPKVGVERLVDVGRRLGGKNYAWANQWIGGITLHKSHRDAKALASAQINGGAKYCPPKLIPVSNWIFNEIQNLGTIWLALESLEEAEYYEPGIYEGRPS